VHLSRRVLLVSSACLVAAAALAGLVELSDAVFTRELGAYMSDNVKTVQGFFAAQYAGDFDRAFDFFADPGFEWVVSTTNDEALNRAIPWAGTTLVGKEGYKRLTTQLWTEFEPLEFELTRFTDGDERVFAEGHFLFRHRSTGKTAASDFVARFEMRDGKIAGGQFYENTYAVAQARSVP
jgi:ketosteroid isomerase-like protein